MSASMQEREFARFLKVLDGCGCLNHVILIGSWAEFIYGCAGVLEGYRPGIKTMDMDFLIRNLRRPNPAAQVALKAREAGYLVDADRLTGVTKIYDKMGLEVEFLIGKVGAGLEDSLKTNLGVTAQSLRHLDILARGMMTVDYLDMRVHVPSPAAYMVHKMVINGERGLKKEKDALAIARIWPFLSKAEIDVVVESLSRKEARAFAEYVAEHGLS